MLASTEEALKQLQKLLGRKIDISKESFNLVGLKRVNASIYVEARSCVLRGIDGIQLKMQRCNALLFLPTKSSLNLFLRAMASSILAIKALLNKKLVLKSTTALTPNGKAVIFCGETAIKKNTVGWETASGRYELVSSEISILSMHKGVLSVEATPLLNLLNPVSNQTTNLQSRALLADTGFSHKAVDFTICADKSYFPVSDVYSLHAEYIKSISSQPVKGLKRLTLLSEHIFLPSLSFELLPAAFVSQSLLFLAKQSSMVRVRYPSHKGSFADILNSL